MFIRKRMIATLFIASVLMCSTVTGCGEDEITYVVEKNDATYSPDRIRQLLDTWQHKTFNYFTDGADPASGMALEGSGRTQDNVLTTGGTGFGLMALVVGTERGWISRDQAAGQILRILNFLDKVDRYEGVWSHWYNFDGSQHAFEAAQEEAGDIVETSFLVSGFLCVEQYFNAMTDKEIKIRKIIDRFWNTINWRHYANNSDELSWYWSQKTGEFSELKVGGNWNETWSVWLQALAAPEGHNMTPEQYKKSWLRNGALYQPRNSYGYAYKLGWDRIGPLFFSHYSFLGYNPRQMHDGTVFYWDQNVKHTMINRHYCLTDASKTYLYDEGNWGLSACYGTPDAEWVYHAREAHPDHDDGVITPTAALSAYPYTPFYSTQVLLSLAKRTALYGEYGFGDAYRPSTGSVEKRHLAIDQGPIVVMIENYRSGLIWNLMMDNPRVRRGLELAGVTAPASFDDGFHIAVPNTLTGRYDMMRHPDRLRYEIDFYLAQGGEVRLEVVAADGTVVHTVQTSAHPGENQVAFDSDFIRKGRNYELRLSGADGTPHQLPVVLH